VIRDKEEKPYTVRYDAVNAMLLNEFLKEHRTVKALKKEIEALTASFKQQNSKIQKISDQIQLRNLRRDSLIIIDKNAYSAACQPP
jgi:DNA-binding protein H-NS